MSKEWEALGNDAKAKQKYVNENKEAFEKLGVSVDNVAQAENLLVDNKDAFIESLLLKAKAAAAMEMASEKYKEAIKKMLEAEKMPDSQTRKGMGGRVTYQIANTKKAKALKEAKDSEKEAGELIVKSVGFSALEKSLLAGAGIQVKTKTKQSSGGETDKSGLLSVKQIREAIRAVEDLQYQVDNARIAAMQDGAEKTLSAMKLRHEREMLELGRQREDLLEKKREDARALFAADALNKGKTFDASGVKLSPEEEAAFGEILKASLQKQGNELETYYKENLKKYQSYNAAYLELQKKFQEERQSLTLSGADEETLRNYDKAQKEATDALNDTYAQKSETFKTWIDEIAVMGVSTLKKTLFEAERELAVAEFKAQQTGHNPEELSVLRAQVKALQEQLKTIAKEENKVRASRNWKDTYEVLERVNNQLKDIGTNVGGAAGELIAFATSLSTSTLTMISGITELSKESVSELSATADTATKVFEGVEKASVILTVIGAALKVLSSLSQGIKSIFDDSEEKKYLEDLTKTQDVYNQSLIRTAMLHEAAFNSDKIGNTLSDVMALGDAIDDYNKKLYEQQEKWVDPKSNVFSRITKAIYTLGQSENPLWGGAFNSNHSNNGTTALRDNLRYITKHANNGFLGIGGNHTKTTDLEEWVKNNLGTELFGKNN
ncbi:hypothetical protein EZS27_030732, partial [termite gut metagenome]